MPDIINTPAELADAPVGTVLDDSQDVLLKIATSGPECWLTPGDELPWTNDIVLLPAKVLRWGKDGE